MKEKFIKRARETFGYDTAKIGLLKLVQPYFDSVISEEKKAEIRKDDKQFSEGDLYVLAEYNPTMDSYSGAACLVVITHILRDIPQYGLKEGYAVWSFRFIGMIKI